MLLRSSSTPVLGSLLSSFSESPSNHNHHHHHNSDPHTTIKPPPIPTTTLHQNHNKNSFLRLNYTQFSFNSSPISPSISDLSGGTQLSNNGFRRAQSEGNLEGLITGHELCKSDDEFSVSIPQKKFLSRRRNSSHLETIPSFSFHGARIRYEDELDSDEEEEAEEEEGEESEEINGGLFENSYREGEKSMGVKNRAMGLEKQSMGLDDEIRVLMRQHSSSQEMYLARGLGVESVNIGFGGGSQHNGGGGDRGRGGGGGDGGSGTGIEEHYKRMVEENPGNPLFLRNYAQFLYESKGDLKRAEEYYARAILVDPKDGEVLSQYAKLVWELHHDQDRALSYFERAVHAAPEDSRVHAAYASFLWETEDDEEEDGNLCVLPSRFQNGAMASTTS